MLSCSHILEFPELTCSHVLVFSLFSHDLVSSYPIYIFFHQFQARAVVGLGTSTAVIVRSTQLASGFDLCDGTPHTIELTITEGLIEMTIDEQPADSLPVSSQSVLAINDRPLYIGGISSKFTIHNWSSEPYTYRHKTIIINTLG